MIRSPESHLAPQPSVRIICGTLNATKSTWERFPLLNTAWVWDEKLSIFDQKYGANWTTEHNVMPITNYETNETFTVQRIVLQIKGTNLSTKDRCKIWATNFDTVIEHHDALGPYHSQVVIELISKGF